MGSMDAFGQPVGTSCSSLLHPARGGQGWGWPGLGLWKPLDVRVTPCSCDTSTCGTAGLTWRCPVCPPGQAGPAQPVSCQESEEKPGEGGLKALSLQAVHCLPLERQPRVGLSREFLTLQEKTVPRVMGTSKLGVGGHPARNVHGQPEWAWNSCWTQVKASPESPTPGLTMNVTNRDP